MTLEEIKLLVVEKSYRYSRKVQDAIEEGFFDLEDLEHCILSATKIQKREKDELKEAVHGTKYVILGRDSHGRPFYTVGKVVKGAGGRLYFFISAHTADYEP